MDRLGWEGENPERAVIPDDDDMRKGTWVASGKVFELEVGSEGDSLW